MVGSRKSVLCHVSTDFTSLVLGYGTTTVISNSYKSLLIHFPPSKVEINSRIRNILFESPFIKVHPKIIPHYQSVANITGKKSDKSIPKVAQLLLPFRYYQKFVKKL